MLKKTLSFFDSIRDKVYYIKQADKAVFLPAYQLVKNTRLPLPVKGVSTCQ